MICSSFCIYKYYYSNVVDIDYVFSLMKKDEFIAFNKEKNDDVCLDIDSKGLRLNFIHGRQSAHMRLKGHREKRHICKSAHISGV